MTARSSVPRPAAPLSAAARLRLATARAAEVWPGSALAALVAVAATFVSTMHGGPQFLYALFFGVAFNYLSEEPRTRPGIEFCSRTLLRWGVGLLGARITASQIAGLGWTTALIVIGGVATTLALGLVAGRRFGLTRAQGALSGGAVAICGASAALAISAVLPRNKDSDRFTLMVVVTVTVLSTVAMVIYPLVARALHLPPDMAGLFIGGTIHDVAQVVGAGYTLGPQAGDVATIVKLFRVAMLALVVVVIGAAFRREREQAEGEFSASACPARQPLVPWFLWLFIGGVLLNSAHALPALMQEGLNTVSRTCLVVAIGALGIKTSFRELARAGWRPMLLIVAETLWLAAFVVACILLRGSMPP